MIISDIRHDTLHAAFSEPAQRTGAGVLLLPTVFGINQGLREYMSQLTQSGFVALAWNPYSGKEIPKTMAEATTMSQRLRDVKVRKEQAHWLGYMRDELKLRRVGVIGWCMGGRLSLLLAGYEPEGDTIDAVVSYYPSIFQPPTPNMQEDTIALAGKIRAPVWVTYPGQDRVTSDATFHALQDALQGRPVPTSVAYFPDAEHAYLGIKTPANQAASALAWPQSIAFLKAALA